MRLSSRSPAPARRRARPALALALLALAAPLPAADAGEEGGESKAPPPAQASPAAVPLTVRIGELENDRGRVAVALFASAKDFPDQKKALAGKLARIEKGLASVTFEGVPPGVYAVAVLHDENENDKMDFNLLGMPREGYGFSNDASAPFGPPSFEAAAFKLSARPSFIRVKMRYFL